HRSGAGAAERPRERAVRRGHRWWRSHARRRWSLPVRPGVSGGRGSPQASSSEILGVGAFHGWALFVVPAPPIGPAGRLQPGIDRRRVMLQLSDRFHLRPSMSTPNDSPNNSRRPRRFVPADFVPDQWEKIAPFAQQLLDREIDTPAELERWLADASELS